MPQIGWFEILIVVILAILIVGPKDFRIMIKKISGNVNDYSLQFKVTSNAGRSHVFHQLGIPVVADFWPSNFEILTNPNCGRLAHSSEASSTADAPSVSGVLLPAVIVPVFVRSKTGLSFANCSGLVSGRILLSRVIPWYSTTRSS